MSVLHFIYIYRSMCVNCVIMFIRMQQNALFKYSLIPNMQLCNFRLWMYNKLPHSFFLWSINKCFFSHLSLSLSLCLIPLYKTPFTKCFVLMETQGKDHESESDQLLLYHDKLSFACSVVNPLAYNNSY